MKKYGIIYKIRNRIDNKIYFGQTTFSFQERYNYNLNKSVKNEHLKNSILKYGIDNFEIDEEFDIAYSKDELDKLEKLYIKFYDTTNRKYGYNILAGGYRGKHTLESRLKIGAAQLGKLNHMYGKYGCNNPKYTRIKKECTFCGKVIWVQKCKSDRSKNNYCSIECKKKDAANIVSRINSMVEFECSWCHKIFKRYRSQKKGKKHVYCSKECDAIHRQTLMKGENNPNYGNNKVSGGNNGRARKVICVNTGEIFECGRDAEKKYNIYKGGVRACCRGEQKTSGGLEWKYIS